MRVKMMTQAAQALVWQGACCGSGLDRTSTTVMTNTHDGVSWYGEKNQIRAPGRWIACLAEGNSWSAVHVRRKQKRVADMRLVVVTCSGL